MSLIDSWVWTQRRNIDREDKREEVCSLTQVHEGIEGLGEQLGLLAACHTYLKTVLIVPSVGGMTKI